ncbi:MAG: DnaJ domain [Verrucomicrobiota bacterium]|jgi:hypothetical protein
MANPFQTFDLPARPWVDLQRLQERFLALASQCHPDALPSTQGSPSPSLPDSPPAPHGTPAQAHGEAAFRELNEAHRTLQNPVTRIRSILEQEAPEQLAAAQQEGISLDLSDHFMDVATLLREAEAFCSQLASTHSPLSKAILRSEALALRSDLERTLARLDELWRQCEAQLQAADAVWERRTPAILKQLATVQKEMSFLQRWRVQLREARIRMSD